MKMNKVEIGKIKAEVPENATIFCVADCDGESGIYLNGSSLHIKSLAFTGIAKMYEKKGTEGYLTAAELEAGLAVINDELGPNYKLSVFYKGKELTRDKSDEKKRARLLAGVLMDILKCKEMAEEDDNNDD